MNKSNSEIKLAKYVTPVVRFHKISLERPLLDISVPGGGGVDIDEDDDF